MLFLAVLSGCVTFYSVPSDKQPPATIIEKGNRPELGWYEIFDVSQIDGLPVSHIGTSLGSATIRVEPGRRRILITATYRHEHGPCPCRATFPIEIDLAPNQVIRLDGSFNAQGVARIALIDEKTNLPLSTPLEAYASPVPKTVYVPAGNSVWIPIRGGNQP